MQPLVTVLMPVFNGSRYLKLAIDSILSQTYTNFELLIVNDGSTDDTVTIILSYSDPRIRLIQNEKNSGIVFTLNRGIELARGVFIARMDADDIAYPNRLAVQVSYMEANPHVAVVGAAMELFDENGTSLDKLDAPLLTTKQLYNSLPQHNYISHPSVMVRSEIMKKYRYKQIYFEDYELWLRIANDSYGIHKINDKLGKYRIHSASIMAVSKSKNENFKKVSLTRRFYLSHLPLSQKFSWFNLRVRYYMVKDYLLYLYKRTKRSL